MKIIVDYCNHEKLLTHCEQYYPIHLENQEKKTHGKNGEMLKIIGIPWNAQVYSKHPRHL